jgi:hypothetical protein
MQDNRASGRPASTRRRTSKKNIGSRIRAHSFSKERLGEFEQFECDECGPSGAGDESDRNGRDKLSDEGKAYAPSEFRQFYFEKE